MGTRRQRLSGRARRTACGQNPQTRNQQSTKKSQNINLKTTIFENIMRKQAEDGERALALIREGSAHGVCHFNVVRPFLPPALRGRKSAEAPGQAKAAEAPGQAKAARRASRSRGSCARASRTGVWVYRCHGTHPNGTHPRCVPFQRGQILTAW